MTEEIDRLKKVNKLSESIVNLPSVCVDKLKTEDDIRQARETALSAALDGMRGKDYDILVKEIDEMQNKQKRAYTRLYEKVGEDLGNNFLDKLDYLSNKETEADKLIASSFKHSSADVEI